jgi:hypothetical protein
MLKHALAVLLATSAPALAADTVVSSHEVRFDQIAFTCGEMKRGGKIVRYIHASPGAKYIPEVQPAAGDPLARSWNITYRIICEGGYQQSSQTAHLGAKRSIHY